MSSVTIEPVKKQSRSKPKEKRLGQSKANGAERLKTVVRRLPPNLPEQIFWQSVQTWVTDDSVIWKEYCPGKVKKKLNKENVHSRAYIAFRTEEFVAKFSREYDGHVFKDKAGNESQAVVEFAPYQKLPLEKRKVDSRNATIEQDEDYVAFLQSLEAPSTKPHDADQLLEMLVASTERPAMPASTPLLDALKAEKSTQRDKEAIQRNHPHYKDAAHASKREEAKRKAAAAASSAAAESKHSGESTAPLGKRAARRAAAAAAAAQKTSAQAGSVAQVKSGNAPSETKPPSSSPSKGKSARGGKHPPKLSSTSPSQAAAATSPSSPPKETGAQATTPTSAVPTLSPAFSDSSGRRPRPVLGIASRHFEAALSGAGVSKGGSRRERGAEKDEEKEKEKEKELVKDGPPQREKREGGGRRKRDDDAQQASGGGAAPATTQPGVLPVPMILQREVKHPPPRSSHQAPSADATSGSTTAPDTNHPTPPSRGSGKRGRGRGRGGRGRGGNRGGAPPTAAHADS
ncbi:Smg-4/UPF3 family domain containing protein [Russula decolorans]